VSKKVVYARDPEARPLLGILQSRGLITNSDSPQPLQGSTSVGVKPKTPILEILLSGRRPVRESIAGFVQGLPQPQQPPPPPPPSPQEIKCPRCGAASPLATKYCPNCGYPLQREELFPARDFSVKIDV
jgi:hypothetical protein